MSNGLESILKQKLNRVTPSGDGFMLAACPVHKNGKERNPSFSVSLYTGSYRCFSCGIQGGRNELEILLNKSLDGINFDEEKEHPKNENDNVDEAVLAIFNLCPLALLEAGFEEKTLQDAEVGYDTMYQRTTFPIRNAAGRLIAISGRGAPGSDPRYKVYTHWMLRSAADEDYSPRNKRVLYGGHTIDVGSTVIVTEGFKACLWVRQAGYPNTIATMGTKVTEDQIGELRKLADRVIIFFDMDASGKESGKKLQAELMKFGIPTSVLQYEDGLSPDDLTPQEINTLIPTPQGK